MSLHGLQAYREQPYVQFEETGEKTDEQTTKASPFAAQLKFGLADSVEDITKLRTYNTSTSNLHSLALVMEDPAQAAAVADKPPAIRGNGDAAGKEQGKGEIAGKEQDKAQVESKEKAEVAAREKQVEEVRQLIGDLGADKFATRQQATRKLIELGVKAFPTIVEGVQSKDPEVRYRAASVCKQMVAEDKLSELNVFAGAAADAAPEFRFSTIAPEWRDYYETETNKRINAIEQNEERNSALQKLKEMHDAGTLRLSDEEAETLKKELTVSQNVDRLRGELNLHLADYHKDEDPRKTAEYIETALKQDPTIAKDRRIADLISRTHLAENQDFVNRFVSLGGSKEELNLACSRFHFEKAKLTVGTDPAAAQKHILKSVELNPEVLKSSEAPRLIARSGLANDERFMEQYKKLGGSLPDLQYQCLLVGGDEVSKLIEKNRKDFAGSVDKKATLAELKGSFEKAISLADRHDKQSEEFLAQLEKRRAEIVDKMPQLDKDAFKDPSLIQEVLLRLKYPGLMQIEEQRNVLSMQKLDNAINKFAAAFHFAQAHSQAGDKENARTLFTKGREVLMKSLGADVVGKIEKDEEVSALIKELGLTAGE